MQNSKRKAFIVRCDHAVFEQLERRAARCGYASATATSRRPGVARYIVDRGLSDSVLLTDDDRAELRRIHWAIRDAEAEVSRLVDSAVMGDGIAAGEVVAALRALRAAAALVANAAGGGIA